ncbi:MAG: RNA-binding cell elongation regulator Jag/EloR [Bacillota bacterium]|nr:RNA-binding cell elongation regulator Jag/EloR [Bacillota bacterium]
MKTIECIGKTVDEALKNALNELNVSRDKVDVEILDEGSKGLLNIIGKRSARIKVTVKRDYSEQARTFLKNVLDTMGIDANIQVKEDKNNININITGANMGLIIGYRGETLDSLQYLVSLVVNKGHEGEYKRIVLDTENYRLKREETLKKLAYRIARKVQKSGRLTRLEPMNPYERRIIHSALQDDKSIKTYSEGEEPFRRVVIDIRRA